MEKLKKDTALKERELSVLTIYGGLASLVLSFFLFRMGMYWIGGLCVLYAAVSFWSLSRTVVFRLLFLFFLGIFHSIIPYFFDGGGWITKALVFLPAYFMIIFSALYIAFRVAFHGLRNGFRIPIVYAIFSTLFLSVLVLSRSESINIYEWLMILGSTFCGLLCLVFGWKKNLVLGLCSLGAFLFCFFGVLFSIALIFPQFPGDPQAVPLPFYSGSVSHISLYFMIGTMLHGWFVFFSFESRNERIGESE